ncbi:MAG: dTDP-4-dehydrorhamnose 3,5-epimerase [Candidatus Accumulibacter sp.]|uniref:dTDP-4-dehydrorhamnose 3,5-epimerase n=1 Tax=Accumulibacter sp. TaxID=2053492 RepID=UPI001A3910F3|nr:dTDP-4-dehydrorhamnose 3,5-epimerase [Accumulibacter sp.]MBL8394587.1 dTDP-4-dehydrorhamnose 3,5-epimerase [Accumulibacter sp.]
MQIIETRLQGLLVIKPDVYPDSRGYLFESYNQRTFEKAGISFLPVQDNESRSCKGVIRGLHYQMNPHAQAKLIRVVTGRILDVAVDIRKESPTYGEWFAVELDAEAKEQVLIPKGFAHGFSVLSDSAIIQYKCDDFYNPKHERGILLTDPDLGICWKVETSARLISEKDLRQPCLKDAENDF